MQLLDWVVVVTVGAIVLVLLDGFRRKWRDRRNRVVMKLERNIPQEETSPDEFPNSELPNGGARTVIRDTDPPAGSPLQRKRNYGLKDGRDKVRASESEPANVPVLMDPVQIEETDIEHANVFVTAETNTTGFDSGELPPEVLSGLDEEMLTDDAAEQFVTASSDPLMDGMPGESADDYDHLHDEEPEPAQAMDAITGDPGDDDTDEVIDGLDPDFADYEAAAADEHEQDHVTAHDGDGLDPEVETDSEENLEDEEYDPSRDEHYYENEPALLEDAYRFATNPFQRQPKAAPPPRIEPGFGDQPEQAEPETEVESFGAIIDESVMTEFLAEEQEEIRAWRSQSATQQSAPEPPAVAPAVAATPVATPKPVEARRPLEASQSAPQVTAVQMEPRVIDVQAEQPPLAPPQPAMVAAPAAPKEKESKPGFWQSMTGKVGKPAKVEPPKVDQGELFRDDDHHAEDEPTIETGGPQEVIIINVMAQTGAFFHGADLMPVLQHYGLRLGSMNIFHRHTETDGRGPIMFSMANMVKPGTFSLNEMDIFATPGLSFFVQLPNRHGNMKAFELMLATANGVKQALDGVLKDERRSVLTRQTVEHCRQRIRDFELALLRNR